MAPLDKKFTAPLQKSPAKGGWTYVVTDWSAEFFGTRGDNPEQQLETTTGHDRYSPGPKTRCTSSRPATSESMSSRVE
jgi:hypothetical protein